MKLRIILMALSLLAFLPATVGGYLYYSSLKESAFKEAERQAVARLEMIKTNLSSLLSEHRKSVRALAGMKEVSGYLLSPGDVTIRAANNILGHFKDSLDVEVCYLLDSKGNTIASAYGISIKTVDAYRFRLLKKLNLRNNAELSRFAIQNRLVEP